MRDLTLILASASPRRRELLASIGFRPQVRPAHLDETRLPAEPPDQFVLRLARAKARCIADPDAVVLGADTVVVLDGDVLGKPADDADATNMLARLAGRDHQVLTGLCLRRGLRELARVEATRVWFSPLTHADIAEYVATGEPRDKAGAYAIQGHAARFIPRIEGSYSNVVGLPLATFWQMWRDLPLIASG